MNMGLDGSTFLLTWIDLRPEQRESVRVDRRVRVEPDIQPVVRAVYREVRVHVEVAQLDDERRRWVGAVV